MSIKSELHEMIKKRGGTPPAHGGVAAALDAFEKTMYGVEKGALTELFPETTATCDEDGIAWEVDDPDDRLYELMDKLGEKGAVIFDGLRYDGVFSRQDDISGGLYLGAMGAEVAIGCYDDSGNLVAIVGYGKHAGYYDFLGYVVPAEQANTEHTFAIYVESEAIRPIDPKFIVLTSPNGTKYNLAVADDGTLSAVAAE